MGYVEKNVSAESVSVMFDDVGDSTDVADDSFGTIVETWDVIVLMLLEGKTRKDDSHSRSFKHIVLIQI